MRKKKTEINEEFVKIQYRPRYWNIHDQLMSHRFSVLVAHRRFGKTVLSVNHLIKCALSCKKLRGSFAYVGPYRNQAKNVAWEYLKQYTESVEGRHINEGDLIITLPMGSTVRIFGADNPDALRGLYFDGIILDEVAQMRPEVWGEIVRPALSDRHGWALFIGTPKGVNLFYDLYQYALSEQSHGNSEWQAMSFPVTETCVLSEDEVADMRHSLSDNAFRQEMLCDFTASSDNVLISLDDVRKAMAAEIKLDDQSEWPLVLGVDVARYGDDATVFVPRRGLYVYDEIIIYRKLSNVEVAHQLVSWIAIHKPEHIFVDQGQGTGVIDLVRSLTHRYDVRIHEVPFGSRASDDSKYVNKRAEMWMNIREWLRGGGRLPNRLDLEAELTSPTYEVDATGRIKLEAKEKIKARLTRSTDIADALALTFAVHLPAKTVGLKREFSKYGERPSSKLRDWLTGYETEEKPIFEW